MDRALEILCTPRQRRAPTWRIRRACFFLPQRHLASAFLRRFAKLPRQILHSEQGQSAVEIVAVTAEKSRGFRYVAVGPFQRDARHPSLEEFDSFTFTAD